MILILAGVAIATLTGDNGLLTKAGEARNTNIEAEGLESIKLAVMASHDDRGINTTALAKNLSQIDGVTDTNNQVILKNSEITLPKTLKLYNFKYKINKDGDVIISNPRIPDVFQEVEYIESDGTQYIISDIYSNTKWTHCEINFKIISIRRYGSVFGAMTNAMESVVLRQESSNKIAFYGCGNGSWVGSVPYSDDIYLNIDIVNSVASGTLNGTEISLNVQSINLPMGFFCRYNYYQNRKYPEHFSVGRWFSGNKFTYDGVVHEFVPCYCTTTVTNSGGIQCDSGTKGLYDLGNGKFYTNANTDEGAVDFTAGPEI